MSVSYGKGAKGKATKLHSQLVRARGHCERCGNPRDLQCAHIIKRRFSTVRTDESNAFCLCAGCHFRLEIHPDEFLAFVASKIGMEEYDRLKTKALSGAKVDWDAEVVRLQALLKEAA